MKITKLFLILFIIAVAIIASLWTLGIITEQAASDGSGKILGVLAIVAVAVIAISSLARNKNTSSDQSESKPNSGPQF